MSSSQATFLDNSMWPSLNGSQVLHVLPYKLLSTSSGLDPLKNSCNLCSKFFTSADIYEPYSGIGPLHKNHVMYLGA